MDGPSEIGLLDAVSGIIGIVNGPRKPKRNIEHYEYTEIIETRRP
jgi:hypothetical protein